MVVRAHAGETVEQRSVGIAEAGVRGRFVWCQRNSAGLDGSDEASRAGGGCASRRTRGNVPPGERRHLGVGGWAATPAFRR